MRRPQVADFDGVRFHAALVQACKGLNVSIARFARDAGINVNTIDRMQRGGVPSLAVALVLCQWAGLDPMDYLVLPDAANDGQARATA